MSQLTLWCRSLPLLVFAVIPLFSFATQSAPTGAEPPQAYSIALSYFGQGASEPEVVTFPIHIYIESEVKVEVRDAWGEVVFLSESAYPEGDREIRVSMGRMEEGLYFVRVGTDLEELSEMVIIDRAQP